MEGAAPAAPAAGSSSNGVSNGTPAPASSTATQAPQGASADGTQAPKGAETSATPSPQASVEKLLRKLRLNGQDVEVDMASPEALRELQIARASAYKQRQFAEEQKSFQRMQERLAAGDPTALQELGIDVAKLHQDAIERETRLSQMTPEQKALAEREAAIAARERAFEAHQKQLKANADAQKQRAYRESTFQDLLAAAKAAGMSLEQTSQRGAAIALAARLHRAELKKGRPPMSPEQLGAKMEELIYGDLAHKVGAINTNPAVRARRMPELKAMHAASVSGLKGEALLEFYGPEHLKEIYAAGLERAKARNPVTGTPMPQSGSTTSTNGAKVESYMEARARYGFG